MWKINSSLLGDPNFISYFTSELKIFYKIHDMSDVSPSTLWETSKVYSRGLIMSYVKTKRRKVLQRQRVLETKLSEPERKKHTEIAQTLILKKCRL